MPSAVENCAHSQRLLGSMPIVRSVPGPVVVERVQAERVELAGDVHEAAQARAPRRDRIGFVEPAHVPDLLPQPRQRLLGFEIGMDALPPTPASGTGSPSSSSGAR